jgi:Glycosyl hydrolases family 43
VPLRTPYGAVSPQSITCQLDRLGLTVLSATSSVGAVPISTALRARRQGRVLLLAAAVAVASLAIGLGHWPGGGQVASGAGPIRSGVPAGSSAPAGLPRLGPPEAVERDDVGDPFVLPIPRGVTGDPNARYVLFWTTDWRSNVPTAVSSDLVHWRRVADALPVVPSWATDSRTMTWGPSALRVPGGWILYFSTEEASSGRECIGRAFATDPAGPYVDRSASPLVCQRALGGDIDPSVTRSGSGQPFLVWKNDGNALGMPTSIWEQRLSTDGQSLAGVPHRLLGADQAWEHGIVEGPSMLKASKGGWWLFYSGGVWQSDTYDTGVAWCATVAGPCHDAASGPILASTPGAVSPGGLDTFVDHHGRLWASYSAFPSLPANSRAAMGEDRVLEIAPVLAH